MNTPENPDSSPQWAMDLARTIPGINHFGSQAEIETLVGNIARAIAKARSDALEEAAKESEMWWDLFSFASFAPTDIRRVANPHQIAERIRWLKTQEVERD